MDFEQHNEENFTYYKRLMDFLDTSNNESDRGKALVTASLIEEMLEEIIQSFLAKGKSSKNLFNGPNAPIGSFYAKNNLARSLRLISAEEYRDIELIRKIRNQFAHNVLCSFDDEEIRVLSTELKTGMSALDALEPDHKSKVDDPKQRFSMVSTALVSSLYNRAHYTSKLQIMERDWPD